jgi:hypothetical protein
LGGNLLRGLIGLGAAFAIAGFSYLLFAGKLTGTSSEPKVVPVIKADPAPVKVVPEPTQAAEAEQPKDILAKPGANAPAPVVVVKPATEAPVDVNAAIKSEMDKTEKAGTAIEMPPAPKPGPSALVPGIGEPKPVRTVTVRPDGTVVGDTPFSPLPAPAQNVAQAPAPQATVAPTAPAPQDTAPQPAKAVPAGKTAAATTPATAAGANAPGTTTAGAPVVLPPQRPADKNAAKVQPQAQVQAQPQAQPEPGLDALAAMAAGAEDATPAAAAPAKPAAAATTKAAPSSGEFSIQFGAPTVEADAKGLAKRISTKFASELGGIDVAVIKADAGGKTVYRVRAQGLSRDDAAALCAKIAAQGAQCFVAKS